MKRFLLFGGEDYYPRGGWSDFEGDYDSVEEAQAALLNLGSFDWHQIVDKETGNLEAGGM